MIFAKLRGRDGEERVVKAAQLMIQDKPRERNGRDKLGFDILFLEHQ